MSDRRLPLSVFRSVAVVVIAVLACVLRVSAGPTGASAESLPYCTSLAGDWFDGLDRDDRALLVRRTRDQCLGAAHWMKEQTLDGSEQVKRQICQDLVLIWTFKECAYRRDYIDRRTYAPCMNWSREMHRRCRADDLAWFTGTAGDDPRER